MTFSEVMGVRNVNVHKVGEASPINQTQATIAHRLCMHLYPSDAVPYTQDSSSLTASDRPEKRGPKLGDAASLWNFTPSPGWTKEEAAILKLCLMKYGVGRWVTILETGLLPGKLIQQLSGQTQRLIGQQSLAACTGLQVDIDRIRTDNEQREDVERKGGLIIWSGPNPTKCMKEEWQRETRAKYGLTAEQLADVDAQLEELAATITRSADATADASTSRMPFSDLMEAPLDTLSREQKVLLLKRLRAKLASLVAALTAKEAGAPVTKVQGTPVKKRQPLAAQTAGAQNPACDAVAAVTAARGLVGQRGCTKRQRAQLKPGAAEGAASREPKRRGKGRARGKGGSDGSSALAEAEQAATEADIASLQGMGFSRAKAVEALDECSYRLDSAVHWLLCNCT